MVTRLLKRALLLSLLFLALTPLAALGDEVTYTYDAVGRLLSAVYESGARIDYTYDAAGNCIEKTVTGPPKAPVAAFKGEPTTGDAPLTVQFTDQSTGTATAWAWSFGDGGASALQNPSHAYANAGTYTVTLTVTGLLGSDSETKAGYITVTEPDCAAEKALNARLGKDSAAVLDVLTRLRGFRADVLGRSEEGQGLIEAYVRHAEEVNRHLSSTPGLSGEFAGWLIRVAREVEVSGEGFLIVPTALMKDGERILDRLKAKAGGSLKRDIVRVKAYVAGHTRPLTGNRVRFDP